MFNLEQSIAQWRQQMLAAGIKAPVPLDELEAHLRDDIEQQLKNGSTAQAAFDAAAEQLGRADVLRHAFKQDQLDIRLLSPIYMRMYCFLVAPLVMSTVWTYPAGGMISVWQLVSVTAVLLIALYIGGLPFFYRWLFARHIRLMRAALRITCLWFVLTWPALALLSAFGLIHIGNAAAMVGWSVILPLLRRYWRVQITIVIASGHKVPNWRLHEEGSLSRLSKR